MLELDALGDELEFEDEEIPSYLQEDELDLPKTAETDPKLVKASSSLNSPQLLTLIFSSKMSNWMNLVYQLQQRHP